LGKSGIDERLQPFTRLEIPCVQLQDLILPTDLKNELINLSSRPEIVNHGMTFHLMVSYGVGKHSTASAISHGIGKKILRIDTLALVKSEFMNFDKRLELVNREALINSAVAYWENFDCLLVEEYQSLLRLFLSYLNRQTRIVFISGKKTWKPKAGLHKNPYISFMIPLPKYIARVGLWEKAINGNFAFETNIDVGSLSNRFILSGGQIEDIIVTAKNRTLTNRPDNSLINIKDLYSACRAHSNQNLNDLAQKITPKLTWDDIVLPRDKQALLKEIINHVKHKQRVYVDWGFERKMSLGKGLTVLFSGASGTGKTLAAEIIAGELDLEIYKIDLSLIVSKYIGETEKNLAKIFSEAETSNAILFFDEADALFGKRSEVKDSHDRYANIEIAYLLQKMEEYEGITILASNLRKNLDEAFVRRIKYIIEFPLPDESHRYQIWQVHLPQQAPLGDDLDFEFLAKKFKLTGGNIKNTILHAAFLSVADESPIRMEHIIHGIQREFQKSGKVCVKGDFGPYFNLLSENNLR
jgi:AAA+ superfamily predicted ATPase